MSKISILCYRMCDITQSEGCKLETYCPSHFLSLCSKILRADFTSGSQPASIVYREENNFFPLISFLKGKIYFSLLLFSYRSVPSSTMRH